MQNRLVRGLGPLLAAALFLAGLIGLGRLARDELRQQGGDAVPFRAVDCAPPPGQQRGAFLDEVQYLAGLPDELRLLEEGLPQRLAEAFGRHPWVEKVERVEVLPPRQVRVCLRYRRPVLAVPAGGQLRAVDGHGVLLPPAARTGGLPVYEGEPPPPRGPAGMPWGDAAVEAAARAAAAR